MSDTTIESLNLQISASTQQAINSINKLMSSLKGLNSSLRNISSSGIRNYSKEIGTMATSLKSLNNIKTTGIDEVTKKLKTLSQMDLSKLDGQKIKVKVDFDTSDTKKTLEYAIQKTIDSVNINADKISKELASSFNIKGDAAKKLQKDFRKVAESMASSFDGSASQSIGGMATQNSIWQTIMSNAKMSEDAFNGMADSMEDSWKRFYDYFNKHQILITEDSKREFGGNEWRDAMATANKRYVSGTKNSKTIDILGNNAWAGEDGFGGLFGIGGEFADIVNQSNQALGTLETKADQLQGIFEAIAKAKEMLEGIDFSNLSEGGKNYAQAEDITFKSMNSAYKELENSIKSSIQTNMQGADGKLPVEVNVNQDKIVRDIKNAINKVAELKYNAVKVNLNVDTQSIKDSITQKLSEIDSGQLAGAADAMQKLSTSLSSMGNINYKDNGLNTIINSLNRLIKTDMGSFDTSKLANIIAELSKLSTIPDVSNSLNRFVNAIAKLGSAGSNVSASANALPKLGTSLKTVTTNMSKVSDVSTSMNTFVSSISKLAGAGNRTGQTAEQLTQLGDGLKSFMDSLKDAPDVSENVLRMTEALGNLASSGSKASSFFNSSGSGGNPGSGGISKTSSAVNMLATGVKNLANAGKNGLSRIVSSFRQIGNSSGSLQTATYNLKNLFATIVGYRGISGILNSISGFFSSSLEGKGILEIGSDIAEIENVVDVSFGSMADKAYEFAESATEAYGLSELAAKEYSGTMMAMLKSSGLGGTQEMKAQAAEMSTTLAGLAGDMASFFNIDTDTAFYKIRAGISGKRNLAPRYRNVA